MPEKQKLSVLIRRGMALGIEQCRQKMFIEGADKEGKHRLFACAMGCAYIGLIGKIPEELPDDEDAFKRLRMESNSGDSLDMVSLDSVVTSMNDSGRKSFEEILSLIEPRGY